MKEYIEREALLTRNMCGNANPIIYRTYAEELIKSAPAADVVEVVRCKDCKNYQPNPYSYDGEMICSCWADWTYPEDDDFCSYGERKEK